MNETRHCDGSYTWGELCVSQRQGAVELNTDKISSNSSSLPFDEFSRIIETLYSSSSSADKKDTRRRNPPWAQLSPRLRDISNDPEGKALLENLKSLGIKNSNGEDLYQKRIFTNMRSTSTWQTHIIKYRRSSEKQGKVDYTSSFRVPADVDMIDSAGEDRLPDFSRLTDATVQDVEAVEGGGGRGYKRVRLLSPAGFDEDLGPATNFMDQLNSNDTLHIILRTAFPSWHIYVKQANVTVQLQVYGAKN